MTRLVFGAIRALLGCTMLSGAVWGGERLLEWEALPSLPKAISGQFAGVSNGALIVAGGSHVPNSLLEGGRNVWTDSVFVLEPGARRWRSGFRLTRPLADGSSVTTPDGLICLGGSDGSRNYADVFALRWTGEGLEQRRLPALPVAVAMAGAGLLGQTLYVAGGKAAPNSATGLRQFWALDLNALDAGWRELQPWPGPARISPAAVVQDGAFYLISGAERFLDATGKERRRSLTDVFRYRPNRGWQRVADVPAPEFAARAVPIGSEHILVIGDHGISLDQAREARDPLPVSPGSILTYHTVTDTWVRRGDAPFGLGAAAALWWENRIVMAGGEDWTGRRSSQAVAARIIPVQSSFGRLDYAVLASYLLVTALIGVYFSRRERTTKDFFLGGGRLPWWAAGLSIFGTQLSALTFMAIPAKAYATDWVYFLVNVCIVLIAPLVIYIYLPFFRQLRITTAYEYLERRFNVAVRLFGSVAFTLLQLGRMTIVVFLPAMALSTVTDLRTEVSILIMGLLVTLYCLLGGIEAVVWADVLQVIVLLGGALLSLALIAGSVDGGLATVLSVAQRDGKFHMFDWTWDHTTTAVWVVIVGNLLAQLIPYTTDQAVVQRYMTSREDRNAARSIWANAILVIPASLLFFGVGTALYVFYKSRPEALNPSLPTDAIFPWYIAQQLPPGLSGLVVAGLFAAAMSTLSSGLNSIATVMVTDFYRRFRTGVSDRSCLRLAKWLTLVFGVASTGAALLMATYPIRSLWDVFLVILGLFGGGLAGIFALGIFTTRANGTGALAGALASALLAYLVRQHTDVHFFLYGAVGVASSLVIGYLSSLVVGRSAPDLAGLTVFTRRAVSFGK